MRAFIAIPLSSEERSSVHRLQESLQEIPPFTQFRWIPTSNVHMTLRFLGEVSDEEGAAAADALVRGCEGRLSFSLSLECLGVFPRPKNPGVLWVGCRQTPEELSILVGNLGKELVRDGFEEDDRPFRPHLTLARRRREARPLKGVREALSEAEKVFLSPPIVLCPHEVVLFRSELRPEGARYEALRKVPIQPEK